MIDNNFWTKAKEFSNVYKNIHFIFTVFPYQISFGFSLRYLFGIHIRLYILWFKLSIDIYN